MMESFKRMMMTPVLPAFFYVGLPDAIDNSHYLETGGFIIPWIAAALIGASVAVRIYWGRIKGFLGGRFRRRGGIEKDDHSMDD